MKDGHTLTPLEVLENRLELKQLKLERALDRTDYDDANIACAQIDFIKREISRLTSPHS